MIKYFFISFIYLDTHNHNFVEIMDRQLVQFDRNANRNDSIEVSSLTSTLTLMVDGSFKNNFNNLNLGKKINFKLNHRL
jgi:hypothetical protein